MDKEGIDQLITISRKNITFPGNNPSNIHAHVKLSYCFLCDMEQYHFSAAYDESL